MGKFDSKELMKKFEAWEKQGTPVNVQDELRYCMLKELITIRKLLEKGNK